MGNFPTDTNSILILVSPEWLLEWLPEWLSLISPTRVHVDIERLGEPMKIEEQFD